MKKIDSTTVITQSSKQNHPAQNQKYVNSRQGGPAEHARTKTASIKHANPEYFKRQADKKHSDSFSKKKDEDIPARKDVPIQRDFNKHQANVGNDPGRGVGCVGKDSAKKDQGNFQMKQFSKGTIY